MSFLDADVIEIVDSPRDENPLATERTGSKVEAILDDLQDTP